MLLRKKEEIEAWLNTYKIIDYELIKNEEYGYIVNVNIPVDLSDFDLKKIEIKFNKINGNFDCNSNELESLDGCPEIVNGNFDCSSNELESLDGCPEIVNGDFNCSYNKLKSLEGCPIIDRSVNFSNNQLKSLEGCPKIIKKSFICDNNKLITLKGCPEIINDVLSLSNNMFDINELKYLPKTIKSNYINLEKNKELKDLQKIYIFNELKEKINIYFEKENLFNLIKNKNKKNNLNKI